MRSRITNRLPCPGRIASALTAFAWLAMSACSTTTTAYKGPEQPKAEIASLEADHVVLDSIDELPLHGKGGTFELAPGPHELSVRFEKWEPGARLRHDKAGPVTVCFVARREHAYAIRPTLFGPTWGPEIIDKQNNQRVAMRNPIDPPLNCARKRPAREPAPE